LSDEPKFGERKDITDLANKLVGKTVIVTGTLENGVVHLTSLKADDEYVKETTELEVRGRLEEVIAYLKDIGFPNSPPDMISLGWNVVVDGKAYTVTFNGPELLTLAKYLNGKTVVLTGELKDDIITVKTLKAAE